MAVSVTGPAAKLDSPVMPDSVSAAQQPVSVKKLLLLVINAVYSEVHYEEESDKY